MKRPAVTLVYSSTVYSLCVTFMSTAVDSIHILPVICLNILKHTCFVCVSGTRKSFDHLISDSKAPKRPEMEAGMTTPPKMRRVAENDYEIGERHIPLFFFLSSKIVYFLLQMNPLLFCGLQRHRGSQTHIFVKFRFRSRTCFWTKRC